MFKQCPKCGGQWKSRNDFLDDPNLELAGYQVNFKALTAGIFLFNHDCKATLAVYALQFRDLYGGPVFTQNMVGTDECLDHCRHQHDLAVCAVKCECAWVRKILQVIKSWPKCKRSSAVRSG